MLAPCYRILMIVLLVGLHACNRPATTAENNSGIDSTVFPPELVSFDSYEGNPLFSGTGADTWDENIRERGFIIKEADGYHLWYTGYRSGADEKRFLGYATSSDGIKWNRFDGNPIFKESWVEDMFVLKHGDLYYMFAEGTNDVAHILTSPDKINWTDHGHLQIYQTNGEPIPPGAYGTPTVYVEDGVWHLFYERTDRGIWHATSTDLRTWNHVQDDPVIAMGPEDYDKYGVALNQIIRYGDRYYAYYHGTPEEDWSDWNTNVAVSTDLNTWMKYPGNPILRENKSSGIVVHDGEVYRLYTMHDQVQLHFPKK